MKKSLVFLCLFGISMSCHKDSVELTQEIKATILGSVSGPYAGCDFSYSLLIETKEYETKLIPEPYAKAGTLVWIRYKQDESCTQIPKPTNIITITSIRNQ